MDASLIRQALERIVPVTDADTEKAHLSLLTFHWEHDAEIAVRRRRRHRAHATMLVVLLLTLMTAVGLALGVNIWQVAYKWAAEQLFMQLRPNEGASLPVDDASGLEYIADVWGDAVYEMMMEHDIHVRLPAWKPEGFELESVTYRQISASSGRCSRCRGRAGGSCARSGPWQLRRHTVSRAPRRGSPGRSRCPAPSVW